MTRDASALLLCRMLLGLGLAEDAAGAGEGSAGKGLKPGDANYGGMRFNDPSIRSEYDSGVIEINCDGARTVLRTEHPDAIRREEGNTK